MSLPAQPAQFMKSSDSDHRSSVNFGMFLAEAGAGHTFAQMCITKVEFVSQISNLGRLRALGWCIPGLQDLCGLLSLQACMGRQPGCFPHESPHVHEDDLHGSFGVRFCLNHVWRHGGHAGVGLSCVPLYRFAVLAARRRLAFTTTFPASLA